MKPVIEIQIRNLTIDATGSATELQYAISSEKKIKQHGLRLHQSTLLYRPTKPRRRLQN